MQSKDEAIYDRIINKISLKYRVPYKVVKAIVESQFEFTEKTLKGMDFKELESKEEFDKLKTNFNFKHLFKLHTDYKIIEYINKNSKK